MDQRRKKLVLVLLQLLALRVNIVMILVILHNHRRRLRLAQQRRLVRYSLLNKMGDIHVHMQNLTTLSDVDCVANLRMDTNCFMRLCWLLKEVGGLHDEKYVSLQEQVSLFIKVLAHHDTNRTIGFYWKRSGQTVSRYFRRTLDALLKISEFLLVKPKPVFVANNNCDEPWKYFKGCLGALDGTLIDVTAPMAEQPRYRSRKGRVSVNVLGVCDIEMNIVYMLCGWEGSAADARVLRDALYRPHPNGLRVPQGNYYLVNAGYANCSGFLAPYRGRRYHLKEWGEGTVLPQDQEEIFNMKHARARSIIERAFGKLKNRWKILKRPLYYPLKIQNRCIMAAGLLNNFIKQQMPNYQLDDSSSSSDSSSSDDDDPPPTEFIEGLESTNVWNNYRDQVALEMWNDWREARRRHN